jgi:O-antigen/teichoic acid export membrane protein
MKFRGLVQQSSLYTLGNLANRAVGMLMLPVYTHFLTKGDYGLLELIELFLAIASISLGLKTVGDAMVRIYHEYDGEEDRRQVISSGMFLTLILGALVSGLGIALAEPLGRAAFKTLEHTNLIRVAFLALFFGDIVEIGLTYERMRERAVQFVTFSLVQLAVTLALNIWFIAFLEMGVWGFVTAKLITSILASAYLAARMLSEVGAHWNREAVGRMLRFGLPTIGTGLAFFVIHFSDRFYLNHYVGLDDVGIYAVAYKFAFLITYLVGEPFGRAWNVSFYAHVKEPGWREQFASVARYLTFLLVLAGLGIALFIHEAILVLTDASFHAAAGLVPLLVLSYVLRELGDFHKNLLYINKRSIFVSSLTIACAVLNIGLNSVCIPRLGLQGAVLSTLLTWLTYFAVCWLAARAEHRVPFPLSSLLSLLSLSAACYGLDRLASGWLPVSARWLLAALLVALFLGLVWRSRYFSSNERVFMQLQARALLRRVRG